jgi:hypothetical protein
VNWRPGYNASQNERRKQTQYIGRRKKLVKVCEAKASYVV